MSSPDDKPEFDPSQPYQVAAKPEFDPSQPYQAAPVDASAPATTPGLPEAMIRGAEHGLTLGFSDEIAGAGDALFDKVLGNSNGKGLGDLYHQHVAEQRAADAAAEKAHPIAYGATNLIGGIGLGAKTAGFGGGAAADAAEAAVAPTAAGMASAGTISGNQALTSAAGMITPLARGAAKVGVGGLAGAVAGVGYGNPDNVSDGASEAAKGAATGMLASTAVEGFGAAKAGAADSAESFANDRTVRSLNPNTPQYQQMIKNNQVQSVGRTILDNDVIKPFSSLSDKLEAIRGTPDPVTGQLQGGLQQQAGKQIEAVGTVLDASGAAAPKNTDIAAYIQNKFIDPLNGLKSQVGTKNALQDIADDIRDAPKFQGATFDNAQDIKDFINQNVMDTGGWKGAPANPINGALRQAYGGVGDAMEASADKGAVGAGDPDLLSKYLQAKTTYGDSATAQNILTNSSARAAAAQPVSLGSKVLAAGQLASGQPIKAAATVGALKAVGSYGNNIAALGADRLADVLRSDPSSLGPWAKQLSDAAARGGASLGATNYILQQTSPEYRQHIRNMFDEK